WLSKTAIIFKILVNRKLREEILRAPAQVAGEVHAAKIQLAELTKESDEVMIKTSNERRQMLEGADRYSASTKREADEYSANIKRAADYEAREICRKGAEDAAE